MQYIIIIIIIIRLCSKDFQDEADLKRIRELSTDNDQFELHRELRSHSSYIAG